MAVIGKRLKCLEHLPHQSLNEDIFRKPSKWDLVATIRDLLCVCHRTFLERKKCTVGAEIKGLCATFEEAKYSIYIGA